MNPGVSIKSAFFCCWLTAADLKDQFTVFKHPTDCRCIKSVEQIKLKKTISQTNQAACFIRIFSLILIDVCFFKHLLSSWKTLRFFKARAGSRVPTNSSSRRAALK